ncbi:GFA family protein [Hyphobacterium sp.]|uniref:GFA family protein n=1 Tax=Hyphobacterium sp. TaxID=2004662 RepID=UPI003BA97249
MIKGGCHCGSVRWEIVAWPESVTVCNCSLCRKLGTQWGEVDPANTSITADLPQTGYVSGDETLTVHRCTKCGVTTHWSSRDPDAPKRMKINFTTADDPLPGIVRVRHFDGADSWEFLD